MLGCEFPPSEAPRLDAYTAALALETRGAAVRRLILEGLARYEAGTPTAPPLSPWRGIRLGLMLACGMVPPAQVGRIVRMLARMDGAKPGRKG